MTSQQYDSWLVNTIEQITKSVPEGYIIEDLIKYPAWQKFIQSKFLNPTGVEAKELVTVAPYSQYIEETNPEVLEKSNETINQIVDKTEIFGVEIDSNLKNNYKTWQATHPNGIVAYRVNFNQYNTPEEVAAGRIGNPFSETNRGAYTVEQFYNWLVNGKNYGKSKATEAYRQAIINKILKSPEGTPILYYKELDRPSHATVIGYLINNKQLLNQNAQNNPIQNMATQDDIEEAKRIKEHCKGKGDKS